LGDKRNAYKVLNGKSERKRPLGYPRHSRKENIKMCLKQSGRLWTEFSWLRVELLKSFLAFRLTKGHEGVWGMEVHDNAF
jgi:hypothetical protein